MAPENCWGLRPKVTVRRLWTFPRKLRVENAKYRSTKSLLGRMKKCHIPDILFVNACFFRFLASVFLLFFSLSRSSRLPQTSLARSSSWQNRYNFIAAPCSLEKTGSGLRCGALASFQVVVTPGNVREFLKEDSVKSC